MEPPRDPVHFENEIDEEYQYEECFEGDEEFCGGEGEEHSEDEDERNGISNYQAKCNVYL